MSEEPNKEKVGTAAAETGPKAPVVFVSYSHDTPAHKKWVGDLASRLVEKGVDVILDQWDLGLGDDVPKFMEGAVCKADRVLMICTEVYVRKADDGNGGVGYEAMVVTGELVKDLGTAKFVPVVRQAREPKTRPRCVGTRLYIDLSEGVDFEENFDLLLREIHDAPRVAKPALGPNPFAGERVEGAAKREQKQERRLEFAQSLGSPDAAYERAMEIVQGGDRVAWRKFLLAASESGAAALKRWKAEQSEIPPVNGTDWSARYAHALRGVEAYGPLIAAVVAAAETGKEGYADQLGWIDAVLEPADYGDSGSIYFMAFPQTVFFVTQALTGGMLMLSGSGEAAHQLATVKLADRFESRAAGPLYSMTRFTGWPNSFEHSCTIGWGFLGRVIARWGWLKVAFGNEAECRGGIAGYYHLLSFLNFVALARAKRLEAAQNTFPVSVPQCFAIWPRETGDKGYMLFLKTEGVLWRVMEANGLNHATLESLWPKWMTQVGQWLGGVYSGCWPASYIPQANLPQDLKKDPYVVD